MMYKVLIKNMLLETIPNDGDSFIERIVWVSPDHQHVHLINMEGPYRFRMELCDRILDDHAEGIVDFKTSDTYAEKYVVLEKDLSEAQRKFLTDVWPKIKDIITQHGEAVFTEKTSVLIKNSGVSRKVYQRAIVCYYRAGCIPSATVPRNDKRGGNKESRLAKNDVALGRYPDSNDSYPIKRSDQKKMDKGYSKYYIRGKAHTVMDAYRLTLDRFYNNGYETTPEGVRKPILKPLSQRPSYPQFLRHTHAKRDIEKVSKSRTSPITTELLGAPKLGSVNQMAFGPGQISLIDSTPPNVTIVSSLDRSRILGTPSLYLVKDVYSFMIGGFSLTLEEPSWLAQSLALINTVEDKVAYCAKFNIHIEPEEWPTSYLPQLLVGDRGELISKQGFNLIHTLGVDISNNPPYFPVYKAPVELDFNLLDHYCLRNLPGGGYRARKPKKDFRGTPCLTLHECRYLIIHWILTYNKSHFLEEYAPDEWQLADR